MSENSKNWGVNIERENLHTYEQLEELQWNFQERCDLILKVTKKTRLHPLSRIYKFGTS